MDGGDEEEAEGEAQTKEETQAVPSKNQWLLNNVVRPCQGGGMSGCCLEEQAQS